MHTSSMPIPPAIHGRRATPSRRQPPTPKQGDTAAETPVLARSLLRRIFGVREGQDKAGRTYTITIQCTDAAGNSATSTATVLVPHDQRGHKKDAPGAF